MSSGCYICKWTMLEMQRTMFDVSIVRGWQRAEYSILFAGDNQIDAKLSPEICHSTLRRNRFGVDGFFQYIWSVLMKDCNAQDGTQRPYEL